MTAAFRRLFDNARDPATAANALGLNPIPTERIEDLAVTTAKIADDAVTNAKIRNSGALSVIGRSANSTGDPADISASAASDAVLRESGSTIGFGTIATAGIANDAVTNTKLANMANSTIKARITSGTGDPEDATVSQVGGILAPAWNTFTSTVTAGTGSLTSASGTIRYLDIGKIRFFHCAVTITTNGTGASFVAATLPTGAPEGTVKSLGTGRAQNVSGKTIVGVFISGVASNSILIVNYDASYPGADGELLCVNGSYELA